MKRKLTFADIENLEKKAINIYTPKVPKARFWSLEELAKGRPFSKDWIKNSIRKANLRREMHNSFGWKGWTKDKHMRSEMRIPLGLFIQPEFQKEYIPEQADEHEKVKALEAMKKDYPEYKAY